MLFNIQVAVAVSSAKQIQWGDKINDGIIIQIQVVYQQYHAQ